MLIARGALRSHWAPPAMITAYMLNKDIKPGRTKYKAAQFNPFLPKRVRLHGTPIRADNITMLKCFLRHPDASSSN